MVNAANRRLPAALVTTPESLSLMLTREAVCTELGGVHTVIVDEWHELIASKHGVQVQLALARLWQWHPGLVVWGLSATGWTACWLRPRRRWGRPGAARQGYGAVSASASGHRAGK